MRVACYELPPLLRDSLLRFLFQGAEGGGSKRLTEEANAALWLREDEEYIAPAVIGGKGKKRGAHKHKRCDAGTTGIRKKRSDVGKKRPFRPKRSYSRHRHAPTTTRFRMRSLQL
eukprot:COSAG01_NODE_824_length_13299_cov_22.451364_4_plen_115_part_00